MVGGGWRFSARQGQRDAAQERRECHEPSRARGGTAHCSEGEESVFHNGYFPWVSIFRRSVLIVATSDISDSTIVTHGHTVRHRSGYSSLRVANVGSRRYFLCSHQRSLMSPGPGGSSKWPESRFYSAPAKVQNGSILGTERRLFSNRRCRFLPRLLEADLLRRAENMRQEWVDSRDSRKRVDLMRQPLVIRRPS